MLPVASLAAGCEAKRARILPLGRIQDFDYVWDRLTSERSVESAASWMRSPNSFLGGVEPLT